MLTKAAVFRVTVKWMNVLVASWPLSSPLRILRFGTFLTICEFKIDNDVKASKTASPTDCMAQRVLSKWTCRFWLHKIRRRKHFGFIAKNSFSKRGSPYLRQTIVGLCNIKTIILISFMFIYWGKHHLVPSCLNANLGFMYCS